MTHDIMDDADQPTAATSVSDLKDEAEENSEKKRDYNFAARPYAYARRRKKRDRRGDQMSIRMTTATRNRILQLSEDLDEPIAEIVERAINQYKPDS